MTVEKALHTVCLSIGSNLGDTLAHLRKAREALLPFVHIERTSPVYQTKAAYVADQPDFLNAVLLGTTQLDPMGFLYTIKDIEMDLGRKPTYRYGPRSIDIDMLFFDDVVMTTTELVLPHPRLAERVFVLKPMQDVSPLWQHPLLNKTVEEMLRDAPDQDMARRCLEEL